MQKGVRASLIRHAEDKTRPSKALSEKHLKAFRDGK